MPPRPDRAQRRGAQRDRPLPRGGGRAAGGGHNTRHQPPLDRPHPRGRPQRHRGRLAEPREVTDRVQGCCATTPCCASRPCANTASRRGRASGPPATSPRGGTRPRDRRGVARGPLASVDAEVDGPWPALPTPLDMSLRDLDGTGFATAARVWSAYREGDLDPDTYGVDPNVPDLRGRRFLFDEVIYEIAHRFGDELLLWDGWGRISGPGAEVTEEDAAWLDGVAALLLAADDGDLDAEARALLRYRSDAGLHPGPTVVQASPFGNHRSRSRSPRS